MFDDVFSEKVKILPWIGENYFKMDIKILVLGMSTYNQDDPQKSCVRIMAKKVREGDTRNWARYWVRITNLLKDSNEETKTFWDRIAFHNYIQEIMDGPKQRTPDEYWENAKEPFKEILNKLIPDIVIVTGYETFKNLPTECKPGTPIRLNGKELKTSEYYIDDNVINICGMWHPATPGFKYAEWRKLYRKYYELILKSYSNGSMR
jgi:hypothetical protein